MVILTGESFLATGNNDSTDILVLVVFAQGIIQLYEKRAAKRIQGLGSVEGN